jgi:hypothetical protein
VTRTGPGSRRDADLVETRMVDSCGWGSMHVVKRRATTAPCSGLGRVGAPGCADSGRIEVRDIGAAESE